MSPPAAAVKSRNQNGSKKTGRVVFLRLVVAKLQRSLFFARRFDSGYNNDKPTDVSVPLDVKEGHFAVISTGDGHPKRYVVALTFLTHPAFLRLLELEAEEYGFNHGGALTVACPSIELESIVY